jgi:hypothetical protein
MSALATGFAGTDSATERVELHHRVPRCLLKLRERADASALDGAGLQAWLDYETEALRWGVDPDMSRQELAALIVRTTAAFTARTSPGGVGAAAWRRWSAMAVRGSSPSPSAATGASRARSSRRRPLSLRRACSKTNEGVGVQRSHHASASGPAKSGRGGPHHQLPRLASLPHPWRLLWRFWPGLSGS